MFVLVLNQSNLIQDGQNNKLLYKFPNSVNLTNKYIAVSSVTMYYSWFNISAAQGNNTFSYTWTAGATTYTYNIVIPDGIYEVTTINNICQFTMIANGTYWSDGTFNYYPFDIILNPSRYAVQLNTYYIPTTAPTNTTVLPAPINPATGNPIAGNVWPTTAQNPIVTFPSNFNALVGYSAGFASNANLNNAFVPTTPTLSTNYVTKSSTSTLSYLSNLAPQLQPNSSIYLSLSNINNPYSQPSSIIYSIAPSALPGTIIQDRPPNFMWTKLIDGTYNQLLLTFLGTDLQPLIIQDPSMTILLTIRDKDEAFLNTK
jgi:hypothetical protein